MRILLLTHAFNSLTQRLYAELAAADHEVSVELDINDTVTDEAVRLWRPDLIIAPFLKRAIPEQIWRARTCLVVHPGIPGDRGSSALDWAIGNGEMVWGVTVLQAAAEMDAGPVWAHRTFPMRPARKSSLYRNEVTEAATDAVLEALARFESGVFTPCPAEKCGARVRGRKRARMRQVDRRIDWQRDDTATVLRKLNAGDGAPGVEETLFGSRVRLFDAREEMELNGRPGEPIARTDDALCMATRDGAVWIGHLKAVLPGRKTLKLPAARVLAEHIPDLPRAAARFDARGVADANHGIRYVEKGLVAYLHFDFYNGAMSTTQCERLRDAYLRAKGRPTRVIVLMGGEDFWSNGLHLNVIEAASSPADESWRNINAMDDLARELVTTTDHLTVAAMRGNAGAGGVFLALSADRVYARQGVILNPHYKNMGNLFGSEYWTYLLPKRVGETGIRQVMEHRQPMLARKGAAIGLIDGCFAGDTREFTARIESLAVELASDEVFHNLLEAKRARRARDEAERPLEDYRSEELSRMKLNFYGFDPSYHVARYKFVYRVPIAWTPLHLAPHRRLAPGRLRAPTSRTCGPVAE